MTTGSGDRKPSPGELWMRLSDALGDIVQAAHGLAAIYGPPHAKGLRELADMAAQLREQYRELAR